MPRHITAGTAKQSGEPEHPTSRGRALRELDRARTTSGLTWVLNVVHWVRGEPNTRTFRISYNQLRTDFAGDVRVAGLRLRLRPTPGGARSSGPHGRSS